MSPNPVIDTLMVNGVSYYLPANTDEVVYLVNQAQQAKQVVCLRGAAHSRPLISSLEAEVNAGRLYMLLSKMKAVTFNDSVRQVTVEGGCHLGYDPSDPLDAAPAALAVYRSTLENSLVYQLDNHRIDPQNPLKGWALPDLGGIIHQTVGGFLSTGSSGSNLFASFNEQLVSITVVTGGADGARVQVFSKDDPNYPDKNENPFYAVGVGLGMFGVIVSATFQCVDNFNIKGQESTTTEADCPIDLFGDHPEKESLVDFFTKKTYKRIMWWPQSGVNRTVIWQAEPMPVSAGFVPNPYKEIPNIKIMGIETPLPLELCAHLMMNGFSDIDVFLSKLKVQHPVAYEFLKALDEKELVPFLLKLFVPLDPVVNGTPQPQQFQDVWYGSIPMDDKISDTLIPVWFTELWFPIETGVKVLSTLRTFFQQNPDIVGNFSYEIYPARHSDFWLSAAYQRDVFRIDMFWYGDNAGSPLNEFYPTLWNELYNAGLVFRPHWGKFLPAGDSQEGKAYLRNNYPNWDQWMAIREQMDPHQVFVSDYWRSHLFA